MANAARLADSGGWGSADEWIENSVSSVPQTSADRDRAAINFVENMLPRIMRVGVYGDLGSRVPINPLVIQVLLLTLRGLGVKVSASQLLLSVMILVIVGAV